MDRESEYHDWLRGAVGELCGPEGAYEVWWDHDESVQPKEMLAAVRNYREAGYVSPQAYLECETYLEAAEYHKAQFFKELTEMADGAPGPACRAFHAAVSSGRIWDDLDRAGYAGVDLNMESALRHSRIYVNVLLATREELNRDTCSIVDCFGSAHGDSQPENLEPEDLDNALSYLVNQQGYSVGDLYAALDGAMVDSTFIQSAVEEIDGNSSRSTSCIAALIATDGLTYFELCDAAGREGAEVVLPSRDCTIGIFDKDHGGGSLLGIEPERDVAIPAELIFDVQVENAGGTFCDGYTVDAVYGLTGSAWRYSHELKASIGPIQMEDFRTVLDAMRTGLEELGDAKTAEAHAIGKSGAMPGDGRDAR